MDVTHEVSKVFRVGRLNDPMEHVQLVFNMTKETCELQVQKQVKGKVLTPAEVRKHPNEAQSGIPEELKDMGPNIQGHGDDSEGPWTQYYDVQVCPEMEMC